MEDVGESVVREVPLDGDAKLVLIARAGEIFLRLRTSDGDSWRFVTPPLMLTPAQILGLTTPLPATKGYALALEHPDMAEFLNLLLYRQAVYVQFSDRKRTGSGNVFLDALKRLIA